MTATIQSRADADALPAAATPAEIDASCRWPVMFLAVKSAGWLFLASVLALIASLKFHGPSFLAGSGWLTYGRVYPAATTMLVFGFALPAGLAVGLWILCRLCRTRLAGAGAIIAGTALWNFGVFWGVLHLLAGNSSGVEGVELARGSLAILVVAWLAIAAPGLLTFVRRAERVLYPSVWFIVAALFVFPWIASTAWLLLEISPVRGVMAPLVGWWFVANLHWLVLGFLALAAVFYFVPQLSGRPLHSQYSALFTFWLVLLFAPWTGVPFLAPVPAWLPSLSTMMSVFLILPAIATVTNIRQTLSGGSQLTPGSEKISLRFVTVAAYGFALAAVMQAAKSVPPWSGRLQFTLFTTAQRDVLLFGCVALALIGALYVILPRVTGRALPSPRLATASFVLGLGAVVIWTASLGLGGIQQGRLLADANASFTEAVAKSYLTFFRISTLADLMMIAASAGFCWNMTGPVCCACRACWTAAVGERHGVPVAKEGARA